MKKEPALKQKDSNEFLHIKSLSREDRRVVYIYKELHKKLKIRAISLDLPLCGMVNDLLSKQLEKIKNEQLD